MFISAFAFALMSALVKEASLLGIPLLQIIFIRAVISVFLSLADIRRVRAHPLGHRRWLLLARGVTGFTALTSVFFAIIHLPIAAATMLHYMHPVFTALLAFIFLMERPTPATLICIALSLTGLGFMVAPLWLSDGSTNLAFWPVMAGLGGALGSGIA